MNISISKLNYGEALRYLGYKNREIPDEIKKQIEKCGEEVLAAASPRFTYKILDKEVVFAITLGVGVDKLISRLQVSNMADAVIADACANALAEQVADEAEKEICKNLQDGKSIGKRFSPGYGDFPLEAQQKIITLLDADKQVGISLTRGGLMNPIKSITAVAKILDASNEEETTRGCADCNMKDTCDFRKSE